MCDALDAATERERERLHREELSSAQLNLWYAETHRDRKRSGRPFELADFMFWAPREGSNDESDPDGPPPRSWSAAGAAMNELLRRGLLPAFALNFDDRLERAGKGSPPPANLALIHDQAILLAPWQSGDCWCGFLLAEPEAAGERLQFSALDGEQVWLQMPDLPVVAGVLSSDPAAELAIAE